MTLEDLRKDIDDIDKDIKELFVKRMQVVEQIAEYKAENGEEIYRPDREAELLDRCSDGLAPSIKEEYISLVRKLVTLSREHQYKELFKKGYLKDVSVSGYQSKHNRLAISFNCDDKCGSLTYVLSIISDFGVNIKNLNLTNITENGLIAYRVELLMDMGVDSEKEKALITQLMKETDDFKILGTYKI
ncbi:MAG: chorismate mutase [Eubacterium sp.]|nr:chorismate mutase [Eubacterium sp.]